MEKKRVKSERGPGREPNTGSKTFVVTVTEGKNCTHGQRRNSP